MDGKHNQWPRQADAARNQNSTTKHRASVALPSQPKESQANQSQVKFNGEWPPSYSRPSRPGGAGGTYPPGGSYPTHRSREMRSPARKLSRRIIIIIVCLVVVAALIGLVFESIYLLQLASPV